MTQYKLKEPPENLLTEDAAQTPQALFPEIFNISNLTIDKQLPILEFINLNDTDNTAEKQIDVSVELPYPGRNVDLFLFVNRKKRDMFYQVFGRKYTFKDVVIDKGENLIELFYRLGQKRSSSIYCLINRE